MVAPERTASAAAPQPERTRAKRLSVLMPAFNVAGLVERAVRSTLAALPEDSELVVFDDASTDDTRAAVQRIRDIRLVLLASDTNVGVGRALNTMLAATTSRYVARMDGDDICLRHRFTRQLRSPYADSHVSFTTVARFGRSARALRPALPIALSTTQAAWCLLAENCLAHATMFGRREWLTGVDGYRVTPAEDYDLWLRMVAAGVSLRRAGVPGVAERDHADSVTARSGWDGDALAHPMLNESHTAAARRLLVSAAEDAVPDRAAVLHEVRSRLAEDRGRWSPGHLNVRRKVMKNLRRAERQGVLS